MFACLIVVTSYVVLFLQHASASGILTIKSPFLAKEQFGHLLKWLCYDSLAASVEVLVELQLIVNELGFPKGTCFSAIIAVLSLFKNGHN
jgi:hypothetical protein